jgi:hypothetical protein
MSAMRKSIRDYVVAALKSAETAAGDNVIAGRSTPEWAEYLPAISVYYGQETAEEWLSAPKEIKRQLQINVAAWVDGETEGDAIDALDALAEEIETVLFVDDSLGRMVEDWRYVSSQCQFSAEGEKPTAVQVFTFEVTYLASVPKQPAELDDLRTITADWDGRASDTLSFESDVPVEPEDPAGDEE